MPAPQVFPTRVFVSNLPNDFPSSSLYSLFSSCGEILDSRVVWTFGFVEFAAEEAAAKAVRTLHRSEAGGQRVNVMKAAIANTLTAVSTTTSIAAASKSSKAPVCSRLFVGNLDESLTRAELKAAFDPYGAVILCDVKRSYGFVRFETLEEAAAARQALDRSPLKGKPMRIDFAEPRRKAKLFVGGLAEGTTTEDLREAFSAHGIVLDVSVVSGYGFVHFDDDQDAERARDALHLSMLNGSKIKVEVSTSEAHKVDRCFRCGEEGHFAKDCHGPSNPKRSRPGDGQFRAPPPPRSPGFSPRNARGGGPRLEQYGQSRFGDPYGGARDPYGYPGGPASRDLRSPEGHQFGEPDPYPRYHQDRQETVAYPMPGGGSTVGGGMVGRYDYYNQRGGDGGAEGYGRPRGSDPRTGGGGGGGTNGKRKR